LHFTQDNSVLPIAGNGQRIQNVRGTVEVRGGRKYHKGHGWVVVESDHTASFGVTSFTKEKLNNVLMVVLPKVGDKVTEGVPMGQSESPKIISDLVAPATGEASEINQVLKKNPALVNNEPYDSGWLVNVLLAEPSQIKGLFNARTYAAKTTIKGLMPDNSELKMTELATSP